MGVGTSGNRASLSTIMIPKQAVLYMDANLIDSASSEPGASCDKCMMYLSDTSECVILNPSDVKPKAVCGLFVPGEPTNSEKHPPMYIVPKTAAGYVLNGPTMCGNCSQFIAPLECKVVSGAVEVGGCCNGWTRGKTQAPEVKNSMSTNQTRQYLESE